MAQRPSLTKTIAAATALVVAAVTGLFVVQTTDIGLPGDRWRASAATEIPATRTTRYTHTKPVKDGWSVPKTMGNLLDATEKQLLSHKGKGYRMKREGGTFGAVLNLHTVMNRLPEKLAGLPYNEKWVIKALVDKHLMKINKVDINPAKFIQTPGTVAIDIIVGTVAAHFGGFTDWGICVCKRISGTYRWSQHAYCNAVDIGGTVSDLDRVASYMRSLDRQGFVPIAEVLWRVPGHWNHIHFSGAPLSPDGLRAC